jgi:hypothetical protein
LKGGEHALDHFCSSLDFVGAGIDDRLHHGLSHSCAAGHRHHRGADPSNSGAKTNVTLWTLAGQGEVFTERITGYEEEE